MSKNNKIKRSAKKQSEAKLIKDRKLKTEKEMNKIISIFLDESGNTGHNIIDNTQPFFTLAGCIYSDAESKKLLDLLECKSPLEAHFKNLKRRKSGQDGIIRLMSSELINNRKVIVDVFHKKFMTITKIVDLLIEEMFYINNLDLYINGTNIALSNVLFYCLPIFCDETLTDEMCLSFVLMIKDQTQENINTFYQKVEHLRNSCKHVPFLDTIDLIMATKNYIDQILSHTDKSMLDPSIPAFFSQCSYWGGKYKNGFHIIHDDSKSIDKQRELFSYFMDWTQPNIELGYDRRKFNLPLKGKSLNFSRSEDYSQIQVADIIASAMAYWANGVSNDEKNDYLFCKLNELNLNRLISENLIWPTKNVTPESLGTIYDGGLNPANHAAFFLNRAKKNNAIAAS